VATKALPGLEKGAKYDRLITITNNKRKVQMRDVESEEVVAHKSMYSAARKLGHSSKDMNDYNNKVDKGKYELKVLDIQIKNSNNNIQNGSEKQNEFREE